MREYEFTRPYETPLPVDVKLQTTPFYAIFDKYRHKKKKRK